MEVVMKRVIMAMALLALVGVIFTACGGGGGESAQKTGTVKIIGDSD